MPRRHRWVRLARDGRKRISFAVDAVEWQTWANPEFMQFDTGLRLDLQLQIVREKTLALMRASLSPEGCDLAHAMMLINGFLGEVIDLESILNEFSYNIALYGTPELRAPWGWQLFGHHCPLNCLVVDGSASLLALLAFNVGVELAQLLTVALVFPSLYLASRTRAYRAVRLAGATVALAAATGWAPDRLGLLANPLAGAEEAVIAHPWTVVAGLALAAVSCWVADRRAPTHPADPVRERGATPAAPDCRARRRERGRAGRGRPAPGSRATTRPRRRRRPRRRWWPPPTAQAPTAGPPPAPSAASWAASRPRLKVSSGSTRSLPRRSRSASVPAKPNPCTSPNRPVTAIWPTRCGPFPGPATPAARWPTRWSTPTRPPAPTDRRWTSRTGWPRCFAGTAGTGAGRGVEQPTVKASPRPLRHA
jgi:Protein of unknown function (DUF3500)/HupE / UreJ protein